MVYTVYTTARFEKEIKNISEYDKDILKKIYLQLKENPYSGDQLRYRFFREKRLREKRIYYLVYDDLNAVLIVAFSSKKAQEDTIDEIITFFPEYKAYLKKLISV